MIGGFLPDYVAVVSADPMRMPWRARPRRPRDGDDAGPYATVRVEDAGDVPHPGWHKGRWLPSTRLARLAVAGDDRKPTCAFLVDIDIVRALLPGDVVHLVRTPCGGLAISALRDDRLLYAAGAIGRVPTGRDLRVGIPGDLLGKVAALFAEAGVEDDYQLPEIPVEIDFDSKRHVFCKINRKVGPYRVFMIHGSRPEMDGGEDECGAISREGGVAPETAVISTAQMFDGYGGGFFEFGRS